MLSQEQLLFIFLVLAGFYFAWKQSSKNKRGKQQAFDYIENSLKKYLDGISKKIVYYGHKTDGSGSYAIAIDDNKNEFLLVNCTNLIGFQQSEYTYKGKYSDILSIDLIIDSAVVETVKKHAISRAVIGGALFGGAGAVVGAVSAKSQSKTIDSSSASVKITVDNASKQYHSINISNYDKEPLSTPASETAREIYALFAYMMKKVEISSKEIIQPSEKISDKSSIADELQKLANLKDKGMLNDDEFSELKRKLIDSK